METLRHRVISPDSSRPNESRPQRHEGSAFKGGCLCGAVRYEIAAPIHAVHNCHCDHCRKSHGAAFATFAHVDAEGLRFIGGADHIRHYRSSPAAERSFCGVCGSPLFIRHDAMPDTIWVALASLEGDPGSRPSAHIFTDSKAEWFDIADDLPRWPGFPPADVMLLRVDGRDAFH